MKIEFAARGVSYGGFGKIEVDSNGVNQAVLIETKEFDSRGNESTSRVYIPHSAVGDLISSLIAIRESLEAHDDR